MSDDYNPDEEYPEEWEGDGDYDETYEPPEEEQWPNEEPMEVNPNNNRSGKLARTRSYDILDLATVEKRTADCISETMETLGFPTKTAASTLLRYYKWDKSKLISEYTEAEEEKQEEIRNKAGITTFEVEKVISEEEKEKDFECLICLEYVLGKNTFALACGHRYCCNCWTDYLSVMISTELANCIWTRCPYPKCNELVHENAFKMFAPPKLFTSYETQLCRSMVLENPIAKFCPAPDCQNAIVVDRENRRTPVSCSCGFVWCFMCGDFEIGDHIPATCDDVEAWKKKAVDESENVKWMMANTKKCPACRSAIEKNGGCMHMTCRKEAGGCGFEFCWLCRGDWKEHGSHTGGYYNCNKYEASTAKKEDDSAALTKTELERYQFFYTRYEAHRDAMKIADKQRQTTEARSQELIKRFRARPEDTIFLTAATDQLIKNRGILKNSYIFGFFLEGKNVPKKLFEFSQEELEKHTNHLSELYEKSLDAIPTYDDFMAWRTETIKYTATVANYRDKFVESIVYGH